MRACRTSRVPCWRGADKRWIPQRGDQLRLSPGARVEVGLRHAPPATPQIQTWACHRHQLPLALLVLQLVLHPGAGPRLLLAERRLWGARPGLPPPMRVPPMRHRWGSSVVRLTGMPPLLLSKRLWPCAVERGAIAMLQPPTRSAWHHRHLTHLKRPRVWFSAGVTHPHQSRQAIGFKVWTKLPSACRLLSRTPESARAENATLPMQALSALSTGLVRTEVLTRQIVPEIYR